MDRVTKGQSVGLAFYIKQDNGETECFIVSATFTGKKTTKNGVDFFRFENDSTARPYMLTLDQLNTMLCADLDDCEEIVLN